ncbi:hypothetical protein SEA_TORTELLINI_48 [Mycobacterium phage Tortellini]|uniref:Uncharacterized protein n=1 Tax=Mycobacterium phage Tortellini TaxID=1897497 RepID=A0A1D8EX48_9CAUD|nr:hypothetical protein FDH05_gp48 [Mycobacterium phage Tortellini]AOT25793.1 hypothetical protein SEA_TORTELLINI_48 [Mycobacterium phage Tortellini]
MNDSRVTRAISLLLTGEPRLVDEACDLMEELCEELPAPRLRPVWCPADARQAAQDAAAHPTERGTGGVR